MNEILAIKNAEKSYESFKLDGVSLSLEEGFVMGLVGPNGAGKTTLIKLILNLIKLDEGNIQLFGKDHAEYDQSNKQHIGFVFDESNWYGHLKLREMISIIAPFYKFWDAESCNSYLRQFDLPVEMKIQDMSKGMKMKFSLAIALSHQAKLIIMDEPTSGLDPIMRNELLEILKELISDGSKSILFSSHISSDVEHIADYVTAINQGNILFSKSMDEINEKWRIVKGPLEMLDRDTQQCFDAVKKNKTHFTALSKQPETLKLNFGEYLKTNKVIAEPAGIDEILLLLVKGDIENDQDGGYENE